MPEVPSERAPMGALGVVARVLFDDLPEIPNAVLGFWALPEPPGATIDFGDVPEVPELQIGLSRAASALLGRTLYAEVIYRGSGGGGPGGPGGRGGPGGAGGPGGMVGGDGPFVPRFVPWLTDPRAQIVHQAGAYAPSWIVEQGGSFNVLAQDLRRMASLQTGGITTQAGLIQVHPREAIIKTDALAQLIRDNSGGGTVVAPTLVLGDTGSASRRNDMSEGQRAEALTASMSAAMDAWVRGEQRPGGLLEGTGPRSVRRGG